MPSLTNILIAYLSIMTIIGFFSMYIDKKRAIKHKWRTPEATLFIIALIGGSLGSTIGMRVCRHKTKHWYFVIGMPLILIAHIFLLYLWFTM